MKLTARFASLIVVLVLAIGASCFAGLRSLARLDASLQQVVQKDMQRLLTITTVRKQFRSMVVLERDHLLASGDADHAEMATKMLAGRSTLAAKLDQYDGLATSEDAEALRELRGTFTRWVALDDRVLALSAAGKGDAAYTLAQQHVKDPVSWETVIAGLVKRNEARLAQQTTATSATYQTARRVLIGVALAAMLIAGLAGSLVFLGIKRNMTEVETVNENLEQLVQVRTRALQQREQSIRLILDSTGDGLLTVNLEGKIDGERSQSIGAWFGDPTPEKSALWDFLGDGDPAWTEGFAFAFSQLAEDLLPFDLNAAQMPTSIEHGGAHYALSYRQVFEEGSFAKVLVVVSDVSERVNGERAEREAREQQEVLGHLLRDRSAFRQFVQSCEQLIGDIAIAKDLSTLKHHLHTLKGNSAVYGFASIAEQCRLLEDALAETDELTAAQLAQLAQLWRKRLESIQDFFNEDVLGVLEIRESEHTAILEGLRARRDYEDLLTSVEAWSWGRTSEFLTRLRAQSERVAAKLNKSLDVKIEHNALRTPRGPLDTFWPTLIHVIRNAVDHGIEDADERAAPGKCRHGLIELTTRLADDRSLLVEVHDDGRGLDVDAINEAARRRGLRGETIEDAINALFTDGLTTRAEVTDTSGRGVGMGAVRVACEKAGGTISVETVAGEGTTFIFRFPPLATIRGLVPSYVAPTARASSRAA